MIPSMRIASCTCPFPDYFISKVPCSEYRIHQHLQVMACRWITMKVNAPSRLQRSPHLYKTRSHHRKVGEHIVFAKEGAERDHYLRNLPALPYDIIERFRRRHIPMPSIFERFDLCGRLRPVSLSEKDV